MKYQEFVKEQMKEMKDSKKSFKDKMKMISKKWKEHKKKGGATLVGGKKTKAKPKTKASKAKGGGIITDLAKVAGKKAFQATANALRDRPKARTLQEGEFHLMNSNFCGPGTKIEQAKVRNYAPYNKVDAICRQHDIDYMNALKLPDGDKKKGLLREADKVMIDALKKMGKQEGTLETYRQLAMKGIQGKTVIEDITPKMAKKLLGELVGKKVKKEPEQKQQEQPKQEEQQPEQKQEGGATITGGSLGCLGGDSCGCHHDKKQARKGVGIENVREVSPLHQEVIKYMKAMRGKLYDNLTYEEKLAIANAMANKKLKK